VATHRIPIINFASLPDTSGSVYFERSSQNFGTNDRYPHLVGVFTDTSTKIGLRGKFTVPKNYVGTPKIVVVWATTVNSGNAIWDFDYKAVADGESFDPSADDENLTVTTAAPGTAQRRKDSEMSITAANLAADDEVLFTLSRDGASSDTIAASLYLFGAYFQYADA
jgi:hypothetical protein